MPWAVLSGWWCEFSRAAGPGGDCRRRGGRPRCCVLSSRQRRRSCRARSVRAYRRQAAGVGGGGCSCDAGAEALLARRPEGTDLIKAVASGRPRVSGHNIRLRSDQGQFRPLPRLDVMGVPADFADLERSAILSPGGLERARQDAPCQVRARPGTWRGRAGQEGGERMGRRDPLLGGVYAGRSDQLSFEATIPALALASRSHRSLAAAAGSLIAGINSAGSSGAEPGAQPEPVFTTLAGGLGALPDALSRASGARVRTEATVRELTRTPAGWRLTVGPAIAQEKIDADAVFALPARGGTDPSDGARGRRAAPPGEIEYASMAIVTLAYPAAAFPGPLTGSGYLVPAVDGHAVKAVTFSTVKWPHLAGDVHVVRCSIGRIGEEAVLHRDDTDLAALAAADLAAATGVTGKPRASRVTRWGGGLPQYTVGHLDRVDRIRAAVAAHPGLAVCGAAYDGIGIPACVASAQLAADHVLAR